MTAAYNKVVGVATEIKAYVSKKVAEAKVATKKIAVRALDAAVGFSGSKERADFKCLCRQCNR